ncbi:glycosyltransferase [Roseivirga sp.]|uniref:glycosyltransferase n=1 Tax=Roseivirga sp. TaxID=1964215 RepID=UPI003B8C8D62
MAKILCITSGLSGILNASFELVSRLEALGHEVVSASPQPISEKVKAQGFEYLQLDHINFDPAPSVPVFNGSQKKLKRLVHKIRYVKKRRKQAITNLGMDQFLEKMKACKPEMVIADIELHEYIMTLVASEFNVLLLSQWFSTLDSEGLPPIQSTIVPGQGFSGSKLGIQLHWLKVKYQRWTIFFKKKLTSVYTDRRSVLQSYANIVGFPKRHIRKNYWPGPFSYEHLPLVHMTAENVEFEHEKNDQTNYLGPMVYEQRKDSGISKEVFDQLEVVYKDKIEKGKQLIYCSVSTFKAGDATFLKKVIAAVESLVHCNLIISLGGKLKRDQFKNLPANVFAFEKVPQLKVLKNADLSINHGGIHTINECIHFGVPMLVYSGKRSDQNGCAARLHYHGIGISANKDIDSPEQIKTKISDILASDEVKSRLAEVSNLYPKGDTKKLKEVLESLGVNSSTVLNHDDE